MSQNTTLSNYRGFSTFEAERSRNWSRYDIDLIKRDLLNHFNTRIGERVMRPEFGCRIWDYLMEPMTANLREQIVAEAIRVCRSDARVEVVSVRVTEYENGIRVEHLLNYIGFGSQDEFSVDFEAREYGALMET